MASVFGTLRKYHNHPELDDLYQNISNVILASHTDTKEDIKVLKDVLKDYIKYSKSI